MSQGTLYGDGHSRAILAKGLIKFYNLDIATPQKDEYYFTNFPLHKSPAFIDASGDYQLTEVMAVVLHLIYLSGDNSLLGDNDPPTFHQIIRWMSLVNSELLVLLATYFKQARGVAPYNEQQSTKALEDSEKVANVFEKRLQEARYLVSDDKLTVADLFCASLAMRGFQFVWGTEWRAQHPAIVRWYQEVIQHPTLEEIRDMPFIDKPVVYTPPDK